MSENSDETLFEFPCAFPIKVMGRGIIGFEQTVTQIILKHAPDWDSNTMAIKPSSKKNYISVTATIMATSREQLDAIYQDLTDHPDVLMSL